MRAAEVAKLRLLISSVQISCVAYVAVALGSISVAAQESQWSGHKAKPQFRLTLATKDDYLNDKAIGVEVSGSNSRLDDSLPADGRSQVPPVEVFGAYAYGGNLGVDLKGWQATVTYNLSKRVGIEGDLNGGYGTKTLVSDNELLPNLPNDVHSRMHDFDFGPRFARRSYWRRFTVFGHALFGISHTHLSAGDVARSDTAFSWLIGGGGDVNLSGSWGVRMQADFLQTHFFNNANNHGRVAVGLVYRFYP